jgi:PAS domain S-box-containing protein
MQQIRNATSRIWWLQRWGLPVLVGAICLALTVWVWRALEVRDEQLKAEALRSQAEVRLHVIKEIMADGEAAATALAAYIAGSERIEQWQWQAFGTPLLQRYEPTIVSLQWAPRVWHESEVHGDTATPAHARALLSRPEYEAAVEVEIGEPFPILEVDLAGQRLVTAGERQQHFPLTYQVTSGDRWQPGFDWWSDPIAQTAMARAVDTSQPALSARLAHQTRQAVTGALDDVTLVFNPIFFKGSRIEPIESAEQRWEKLIGFVVVAIHPEAAIELALRNLPVTGVDIHIFDISAGEDDPILLHLVPSRLRRDQVEPYIIPGELDPTMLHERMELALAGRTGVVYVTPTEHFLAMRRSWAADIALGSGIVGSILLAALLFSMISQVQDARHVAASRRTYARQQSAVASLGLIGLRESSLTKLMDHAVKLTSRTLGIDFSCILELKPDRKSLVMSAGDSTLGIPAVWDIDDNSSSLLRYTLQSNEPVVTRSLAHDSRFSEPTLQRHGIVSVLSTRIVGTTGEPCGVLAAYGTRPRSFTGDEIKFLQAVANILGQAMVQHRIEADLRESEERFRAMADAAPVLIWVADTDKRCTYVNRQWLNFTGRSMEQELRDGCFERIHAEERESCWRIFSGAFDRRETLRMQYRLRRADGEYRWVLDEAVPRFTPDGTFVGYIGASIDVTDQKSAEQQLRVLNETLEHRVAERTAALEKAIAELRSTTAALQRSNDELEQFASIASHDLQEPLRKVEGFGKMLQEHAGKSLDERSRDYLQRMYAATGRMHDLIHGLLTYARVTTQTQPFELVSLNDVAEEVISDLQVQIEETGGRIELEELPSIYADSLQMRQLLQNLISNALKFHKPDEPPRIRVYANCIEPAHGERGKVRFDGASGKSIQCRLFVEDNGIGMEQEQTGKLFVPFRRLHGRSSPYKGTGIGLAVCRKIAERHGGSIAIESSPGAGTTVIITLSRQPVPEYQQDESRV